MLHVVPGEENERFNLDEWNRFAVLWEACSRIKFFKNFLFKKFLTRFKQNTKFSKFLKLKNNISKRILITIPCYSEAILHISKLIQEIIDLKFLPESEEVLKQISTPILRKTATTMSAISQSSVLSRLSGLTNNTQEIIERIKSKRNPTQKKYFTLESFTSLVNTLNLKSDQILEYFFLYIKFVLDHTRQKLFDKLRFYEALVNQADARFL